MPDHPSLRDRTLRRARRGHALKLLRPLVSAGVLLSCVVPEESSGPPASSGELRGVVRRFAAVSASEPEPLSMQGAPVCQSLNPRGIESRALTSDAEGHLANTFVYLLEGSDSTVVESPGPVVLEERDCHFRPRVMGMQAGQALRIVNRDPTVHELVVEGEVNPAWSETQPFAGMAVERVLEQAEVMIPVRCDIHPWMKAWVGVVPHSYFAVSDVDGEFVIAGVPAGRHRLGAWHEELGRRRVDVSVSAGEVTRVEIVFGEEEEHAR